ncbi:hypothetical protein UFOVP244_29 [uncultured Caudovirales phage]|uniref:Uncharacterized protein n=1 Tax=uncultured Caudovirales phage TaxID=2100421 RepID=A0A6J7WV73_9CAUD|nr:hypothetical protein UFOVP244_29 [uncultured Caudovirales phage]
MALIEYLCQKCGSTSFVFGGDEDRLPKSSYHPGAGNHECKWEALPPLCSIVHSTDVFMLSQLDSIHTIEDLDAAATREAAEEREMKAYGNARKEI